MMNDAELEQIRRDAYERGRQDALAEFRKHWLRTYAAAALNGLLVADNLGGGRHKYAQEAWKIAEAMLDLEPQPQRGTLDENAD